MTKKNKGERGRIRPLLVNSFTPYQNFPHTGLVSPSGGGHFNEAWLRDVKREKRGNQGRAFGKERQVLSPNSTQVGWQHQEP